MSIHTSSSDPYHDSKEIPVTPIKFDVKQAISNVDTFMTNVMDEYGNELVNELEKYPYDKIRSVLLLITDKLEPLFQLDQ